MYSKIAYLEQRVRDLTNSKAAETKHSPGVLASSSSPTTSTEMPADENMSILLRGVNGLTMDTGTPEFYGPSSANAIINAVEAMDAPDDAAAESPGDANRARLWLESARSLTFSKIAQSSLPPKETADEYLGQFFRTAHRIYPILNRAHFMKRYNNFWIGQPTEGNGYELWVAVLCMVLALGHQCSTVDPDPRVSAKALESDDGEICFGLAKAMLALTTFTGGDMSVVNSILLAVGGFLHSIAELTSDSLSGCTTSKDCTKHILFWARLQERPMPSVCIENGIHLKGMLQRQMDGQLLGGTYGIVFEGSANAVRCLFAYETYV